MCNKLMFIFTAANPPTPGGRVREGAALASDSLTLLSVESRRSVGLLVLLRLT